MKVKAVKISIDLDTFKGLSIREQYSELFEIASLGALDQLSPEVFTKDNIALSNKGTNILHVAAAHKQLDCVPSEILTQELLAISESEDLRDPDTVYHIAARTGCFDQIPQSELSIDVLSKIGGPHYYSENGDSVYHILARNGNLHLLPQNLLTEDVFRLTDDIGDTVAHCAIEAGEVSLFPKGFLNNDSVLSLENGRGDSILLSLYVNGHQNLIDRDGFSPKLYFSQNQDGNSPFREQLLIDPSFFPEGSITEEDLMYVGAKGTDSVTALVEDFILRRYSEFFCPQSTEEGVNKNETVDLDMQKERYKKIFSRVLPILSEKSLDKVYKNIKTSDFYGSNLIDWDREGFLDSLFKDEKAGRKKALKKQVSPELV